MIPAELPTETPDSERQVYRLAKKDLPNNWTVIHGFRLECGQPPREVEADFVVFNPRRGALVVEVKGGGIERDRTQWFSTDRGGERHRIKDPGAQASTARWAIDNYLRKSPTFGRAGRRVEINPAVLTPDINCPSQGLGPALPRSTVIDHDDLLDLGEAFRRVFHHYRMRGPARSPTDEKALLDTLLPRFRRSPALAGRLDSEGEAIHRLTSEQMTVLGGLERAKRVAVEGAAGSGKTLLAVAKASQMAQAGQRVLLLCFNRLLAERLGKAARLDGFEAQTFHSFCQHRAHRAGLPFAVDRARSKHAFWEDEAPEILLNALESRPDDLYDAIVVDEGQDFRPNWWPAVELALRDGANGTLYVFFDPNQSLFDGGPHEALDVFPYKLQHNCRNTRRIADHAAGLIGIEYALRPGTPDGLAVERIPYRTPEEMVDNVRKTLHRLTVQERIAASRITVLSTHATNRSHLAKSRRLGNLNLVKEPFMAEDVRLASLHAFKGLESDVVILVDVDGNPKSSSPNHLYVAATRARLLLIVMEERPAGGSSR